MLRDYKENFPESEAQNTRMDEKSPFLIVVDGKGNEKIVRKSSVCWLLSKDKHKLSSDRLVRVTEHEYSKGAPEKNSLLTEEKYAVQDQLYIGEWAIFRAIFSKNKRNELDSKIFIGMVLGFTYLDGQTFKAREFSKISAGVVADSSSNSRGVGVLCTFYDFNDDGKLNAVTDNKHKFINIDTYVVTINPPIYKNQQMTISEKLVEEIKLKNY